jgi:hypothetical protein
MATRFATTATAAVNACTNLNPAFIENSRYGFEKAGSVVEAGQLYFFVRTGDGRVHGYVADVYVGDLLVGRTGSCKCKWRCKDAAMNLWGEANMAARREARAAE